MKTVFTFLMIYSSFLPTKASSYCESNYSFDSAVFKIAAKKQEIDCKGNLPPQTPIRTGGAALQAVLSDNEISVKFNYAVGKVEITIMDQNGHLVYINTVDSLDGDINISTVGLPKGNYTITFSNGPDSMWGDFELTSNF